MITVEPISNQVGQTVYRVKDGDHLIGDYIDGVNTSTHGIQEAVNYAAAKGGGTILLKTGTYIWGSGTGNVNVKPGVTIKGEGIDATIIQVENSTVQTTIPFSLNSDTRITGISFIMSYNNNPNYTPSAIMVNNPASHVEIDHCSFDQQAVAWYIQFQSTFNSSSPPTGYIVDVRIHDNIFHANIQESSANECIVVDNADGVEIYDNYFYYDTTTNKMNNSFFAVYDYSKNVSVHDNYFEVTNSGTPGVLMYFSDALNCEFVNNVIYTSVGNAVGAVLGIYYATQYMKVANNIAYGPFGSNTNSFLRFIFFGLLSSSSGAIKDGAGGPDGNVSQNAGFNDFITIENNVVIGPFVLFDYAFSGYQNFTFLKVEGNVFATLRGWWEVANLSQNNGIIIFRNNIEIGDLLIGASNVGGGPSSNGAPWLNLSGTSTYTIENVIVEGNRFPYATDFSSATALDNVTLQYITNLLFRDNLLGGSGQDSVGIANYLSVSNVSQAIIEDNWAIDKSPNVPLLSTTVAGPTAGTVYVEEVNYRTNHKKAILNVSGYENDTTTNQTINFPLPFSTVAAIVLNTTGLTISASTSGITITSPNSTTTYSGIIIVEGY